MSETFADTFYFLALLNPRDSAHGAAVVVGASLSGRLVTTEYVLLEVADAFARPSDRHRFLTLLEMLQSDKDVEIIPANPDLWSRGITLYRNRADKDWPLTDCLSFEIMSARGITEALTADEHFRQAGFRTMLG
jgi:predicted nucleic acid-binding protein